MALSKEFSGTKNKSIPASRAVIVFCSTPPIGPILPSKSIVPVVAICNPPVSSPGVRTSNTASVSANPAELPPILPVLTKTLTAVDFRSKNIESIDSLEKNSIDFYASVKSLYLQNRLQKIANEEMSDKTQDDDDWEEIDSQ